MGRRFFFRAYLSCGASIEKLRSALSIRSLLIPHHPRPSFPAGFPDAPKEPIRMLEEPGTERTVLILA